MSNIFNNEYFFKDRCLARGKRYLRNKLRERIIIHKTIVSEKENKGPWMGNIINNQCPSIRINIRVKKAVFILQEPNCQVKWMEKFSHICTTMAKRGCPCQRMIKQMKSRIVFLTKEKRKKTMAVFSAALCARKQSNIFKGLREGNFELRIVPLSKVIQMWVQM